MLDLQKASILKRISAYILDFIVLTIFITGFAFLFSVLFKCDENISIIDERRNAIANKYEVDFNITEDALDNLTDEERMLFEKAVKEFEEDPEANKAFNFLVSSIFAIISLSILCSYIITDFAIPLFFGNGQTIGKKVFALGIMRSHHVRITPFQLFARSILGKCTIETMAPIYLIIMIILGVLGIVGIGVLLLILLLQLCLFIFTKNNCFIHDLISDTVVIDMASQMIFENDEALLEYQKQLHAESVSNNTFE